MGHLFLLGALIVFMVHLYGPGSRSLAFSISSRAGLFTHCDHRKPGCLRFFRHVDHQSLAAWNSSVGHFLRAARCYLLPLATSHGLLCSHNDRKFKRCQGNAEKPDFREETLLGNRVNRRARGSEVRGEPRYEVLYSSHSVLFSQRLELSAKVLQGALLWAVTWMVS